MTVSGAAWRRAIVIGLATLCVSTLLFIPQIIKSRTDANNPMIFLNTEDIHTLSNGATISRTTTSGQALLINSPTALPNGSGRYCTRSTQGSIYAIQDCAMELNYTLFAILALTFTVIGIVITNHLAGEYFDRNRERDRSS